MQRKFFWSVAAVILTGAASGLAGFAQSPVGDVKPGSQQTQSVNGLDGVLTGRVIDAAGRPTDAQIRWVCLDDPKDDGPPLDVAANAQGYFMIQGLKNGKRYKLVTRAKSGDKTLEVVTMTEAPNARLLIQVNEKFGVVVQPKQVRIETMIAEVELTETEVTLLAGLSVGRNSPTSAVGGIGCVMVDDTCNELIRGFETQKRIQILVAPGVITEDNQTARVVVGQAPSGLFMNYSHGVDVTVHLTPAIQPDGMVFLRVMAETSAAEKSKIVIGNVAGATGVNLEPFERNASIAAGETAIMLGPTIEREVATEHKTPLLGDLPWVGAAFCHETHAKKKTHLLMFFTPHVQPAERTRFEVPPVRLSQPLPSNPTNR